MRRYRQKRKRLPLLITIILVALTVSTVHNSLLITARQATDSMLPTIDVTDRVYASSLIYGTRKGVARLLPTRAQDIRYGDLIVMYPPYSRPPARVARIADSILRFLTLQLVTIHSYRPIIRRVIAVAGDQIYMENYIFYVRPANEHRFKHEFTLATRKYDLTVDGLPHDWPADLPFSARMEMRTVPQNSIFVAADNRLSALDSRHWPRVERQQIHGAVFLHASSLTEMRLTR